MDDAGGRIPEGSPVMMIAELPNGMTLDGELTDVGEGRYTLGPVAVSGTFPNTIRFWNAGQQRPTGVTPFTINWEFYAFDENSDPINLGSPSTDHTVYRTRGAPVSTANIPGKRYETLYNIACRTATGLPNSFPEGDVVTAIYSEFSTRNVQRVVPGSGDRDGVAMKYWGVVGSTVPNN